MIFLSPIWLIALLPWAALAVWLLIGRRDETRVPFVHLWPKTASPTRARRELHPPPLALVLLLTALLLAVLGAARPMLKAGNGVHLTIIVDRDVTTSAQLGGWDRLASLIEAATGPLRETYGLGPTEVIAIPGGSLGEWGGRVDRLHAARRLQPVSIRTTDLLRSTVPDALSRAKGPVIVLSEQALLIEHENLAQVTLREPIQNVGIVRLAAREYPAAQVMVVVRNESTLRVAEIRITSAGQTLQRRIELPNSGSEQSYFINMPGLGQTIAVEVMAADELAADNYAWLVRRSSWPRIEAHAALPSAIMRMIDAYTKLRPAGDQSIRVIVTTDPHTTEAAAIIAAEPGQQSVDPGAPLRVEDHPINANVDWRRAATDDARVAAVSAGDWRAIVVSGRQVLVAVRDSPARQVWVGFTSDAWARESDFVVFWTNVFDWLAGGNGGETFAGEPMREPGPEWRRLDALSGSAPLPIDPPPGIWGRDDGALIALNVDDVKLDPLPQIDWRANLPSPRRTASAGLHLAPAAIVAALAAALLATGTWLTPKPSTGRSAAA